MPARVEPSRGLGAEASERLMTVCPSERPVILSAPGLLLKVETSWAEALGAQLTPSVGARVRFGD